MKYILIFICWSIAQGGAPATAEFNDQQACLLVANDIKKRMGDTQRPGIWYVECWPKGTDHHE